MACLSQCELARGDYLSELFRMDAFAMVRKQAINLLKYRKEGNQ
jgi:hypothetical protein